MRKGSLLSDNLYGDLLRAMALFAMLFVLGFLVNRGTTNSCKLRARACVCVCVCVHLLLQSHWCSHAHAARRGEAGHEEADNVTDNHPSSGAATGASPSAEKAEEEVKKVEVNKFLMVKILSGTVTRKVNNGTDPFVEVIVGNMVSRIVDDKQKFDLSDTKPQQITLDPGAVHIVDRTNLDSFRLHVIVGENDYLSYIMSCGEGIDISNLKPVPFTFDGGQILFQSCSGINDQDEQACQEALPRVQATWAIRGKPT
eukprot:TRINITY_DN7027_c0_g1_i1.p1 TRINITY_DN7027_c0_g1~~TRINITY_DN7027_c0_g1_i1.p1  ORF type:complete len:256 (-),score=39.03 TRINITY_DN7027_c0_g1_i1:179-946(-)